MKRSKQTKRALTSSVLALALCFVMLLGTTFAWFTDNASTSVNKVQAGTLDVALEMKQGNSWVSAEGTVLNFVKASGHEGEAVLWEPGATYKLPELRVVNNGNLALKYRVVFAPTSTDAVNLKLAEVLDVYVDGDPTNMTLKQVFDSQGDLLTGNLNAQNATSDAVTISLKMRESAGNAYQGLAINGVQAIVQATQYNYEYDSNGNDYDAQVRFPTAVFSASELKTAVENGGTISLVNDITATDVLSITKDVTIIGNGKTITAASGADRVFNVQDTESDITIKLSNLTIKNDNNIPYDRGISFYDNDGKIRLEMDNCKVTTQHYALNVAKDNADIEVVVRNSELTGYCAAQTWSANSKLTFENCTLTGVNRWNDTDNDFCTVNVAKDSDGGADGAVVTLNNCTIQNSATGTAKQRFFGIAANDASVTATGCTYKNGEMEVAASDVRADTTGTYTYIATATYTLTIN